MSNTMNVPVFIDISLEKQAQELRAYFKGLGAEISPECSPKGIEDDLHKIIGVCDACFKDANQDRDKIDEVLNGIVSMLATQTGEKSENLILAFCEKLAKAPDNESGIPCLKVLWSMFQSMGESSPMRFHVYFYLVQLAGKTGQVDLIFRDIETFKSQFSTIEQEQEQKLLRVLHEVLLNAKKSDHASDVMVRLLSTYTTENASQAREEAQRCIVASLADPQTFLLDHLLELMPVKFLEGELIHDLLKIFVSEKLESYQKFYEQHREFVKGLGLKHEDNLTKMKLLTFMQLAETKSVVTFGDIQKHIQLEESEVEEFVIELLKTKLVRAKLDQANSQVVVSSTMHRTFTREHWNNLNKLLASWRGGLHSTREAVGRLAQAQVEMMRQNQMAG